MQRNRIAPAAGPGAGMPEMRVDRLNADIISALTVLAIGATLIAVLPSQGGAPIWAALQELQSPTFFPALVALFLVVASVLLLVRAVMDQVRGGGVVVSFDRPVPVMGAIALLIAWTIAINVAGMVAASATAICCLGILIEPRHWKIVVPAAIAVPAAVYYLFEEVLRILLPRGMLF